MRFEPLPPLFEGAGWDRVAAAELEAERQRERKECSRLLERTTAGSWTSRDEGENDREAGEECVLFSSFLSSEWAAQSRGKEIAGVLRVARERERDVRKKEIARARRKSGVLRVERERFDERKRKRDGRNMYIYIRWRERASRRRGRETEMKRRRGSRSERGGEKRIKDDETSRET